MAVGKAVRRYEPWTGERTRLGTRLRFFISRGIDEALRSRWALFILLVTYGLLVVPRLFGALATSDPFDPQLYGPLLTDVHLFVLILAAVAGSSLFASDIQDRTIVLYRVRRMGAPYYLVGRLASLAAVLGAVSVAPIAILSSVAILSAAPSLSLVLDQGRIVLFALGLGCGVAVFFALFAGAISVLLRERRYAAPAIVFAVLFSEIASSILSSLSTSSLAPLVSVWGNFSLVGAYLFGTDLSAGPAPWQAAGALSAVALACAALMARELVYREDLP